MKNIRFCRYHNSFLCSPDRCDEDGPCPDVNQFIPLNLNPRFGAQLQLEVNRRSAELSFFNLHFSGSAKHFLCEPAQIAKMHILRRFYSWRCNQLSVSQGAVIIITHPNFPTGTQGPSRIPAKNWDGVSLHFGFSCFYFAQRRPVELTMKTAKSSPVYLLASRK